MTDYGQELLFGTFITPSSKHPNVVVDLTIASERAGLDLATFQDHPYQPAFLDVFTLMSFLAARTERIRLVPSVTNLPLRPPVVLARAAASIDLLSGGRFELGLGAGAFWDAIEASGGRRLAPGESVEALDEAIQIIRDVWAVGEPGGVRVEGKHYSVVGAKRGPAPAHDLGIWIGAQKPRMLRLTGRVADGWIVTLGYLGGVEAYAEASKHVDEGARAVGRDPSRIRRVVNVTGPGGISWVGDQREHGIDELVDLALEHGASAFILASDDASQIEHFGQEIAPAVRERVAASRAD